MAFDSLFERYDRLVILDTETTGLNYSRDEIIEFSAVAVEKGVGSHRQSFAEVEVELKEGSEESAVLFARLLAHRFSLEPEPEAKVVRARKLAFL